MSKRITEAELAAYRDAAKGIADLTDPGDAPAVDMAVRVCDEVLRLRGLLAAAPNDFTDDYCYLCGVLEGHETHSAGCPIGALEAEARAIREEQGLG